MTSYLQQIAARGAGLNQATIRPATSSALAEPFVPTMSVPHAATWPAEAEPMPVAEGAPAEPARVPVQRTLTAAPRSSTIESTRESVMHRASPAPPATRTDMPLTEPSEATTPASDQVVPVPRSSVRIEPQVRTQQIEPPAIMKLSRMEINPSATAQIGRPTRKVPEPDKSEHVITTVMVEPAVFSQRGQRTEVEKVTGRVSHIREDVILSAAAPLEERPAPSIRSPDEIAPLHEQVATPAMVHLVPKPANERPMPPSRGQSMTPRLQEQTQKSAQDIRVSIGRVEVHVDAETKPMPAMLSPEPPPFASMLLERNGLRSSF